MTIRWTRIQLRICRVSSMASEFTIPPVPIIPKFPTQNSYDHDFTSVPSPSSSLPPYSYSNFIKSDNDTASQHSKAKRRRHPASIRSFSKGSINSRSSSFRVTGSTSDISRSTSGPSFYTSSSYDRKTVQFLRSEANEGSINMKETGLLKDLMLKEPSSTALKDFAEQEKRRAAAKGRKQQNVAVSSVNSRQLPASVAKVNSKWNGIPGSDAKRMADGSIKGSASSIRTTTSMRKSTASSITTSKSRRDIGTRFSETLNKFPACPQGGPELLGSQSVGSPTEGSFRNSVHTSITSASIPLSIEEDKLRFPVEKTDLLDPCQILDENLPEPLSNTSFPLPLAQSNFAKEQFRSDLVKNTQITKILVNSSDSRENGFNALHRPATTTNVVGSNSGNVDTVTSTQSTHSLPQAGTDDTDILPPGLHGVLETAKKPSKLSRKKVLLISWRKIFRRRFCI